MMGSTAGDYDLRPEAEHTGNPITKKKIRHKSDEAQIGAMARVRQWHGCRPFWFSLGLRSA